MMPAWMAVLRGLVLLGLGGAGMVNEMFRADRLDMSHVALYVGMILGEGVLSTLWLAGKSPGAGPSSSSRHASSSPSAPDS